MRKPSTNNSLVCKKTAWTHKSNANRTKLYEKPQLICYGDVRDITLGGSLNPGDPGVPASSRRNT